MESPTIPTQDMHDPFAAMRIPEYRYLMIGRFCFIMALRMMGTLVGWWVYTLTKSTLAIGLVGLSEFVPAFAMALYSGHVVDVSRKKVVLVCGAIAYLLLAVQLFLVASPAAGRYLSTSQIVLIIYSVFFFTGVIRSFTGPVLSALVATIVPRHLLQNATTWNQGTWLSASVSGHALGGFLVAFFGFMNTLGIISGVLLIAVLLFLKLKSRPPAQVTKTQTTWESVKEGLKFVVRTKELSAAMALDMFAVLFGGAVAMVPAYASEILHVGPIGLGWLNAATDMGAICIVFLLLFNPMKRAQGKKMLLAVAGYGICIIMFALSKWFWLSFLALMISGMLDGISVVVRGTVMQLKTPDTMRGRVSSVSSMFVNSSNELGQFESGVAAHFMGKVPSVVFGGGMTLLVVILTWFKAPKLRKFEY